MVESGEVDEFLEETGANADMLAGFISGIIASREVLGEPAVFNNPRSIIYASLSISPLALDDIKRGCAPFA